MAGGGPCPLSGDRASIRGQFAQGGRDSRHRGGQGAKAMLCRVADEAGLFVLAVLPGDERVDFAKVAAAVGARKVGLADAADAEAATGCVIGSIPPFSFHPSIRLVVDPQLLARYGEIAFNAGRLDAPMVLYSEDYRRLARPLLADIRKEQA
ncbi:YbaK/EbsC family protein [Chromobacterium paludis]|uniref:YbaK/EbsC family protein n=1 Tax=Chromobacterium paludis TaxID=2605945 RepID=UPI0038B3D69B